MSHDAERQCAEHICADLMPRGTPKTFGGLVYLCEVHGGAPLVDPAITADQGGRCIGGEIIISTDCSLSEYQEIIPHELVHRLAEQPRWEHLNQLMHWQPPDRGDFLEGVAVKVGLMSRGPETPRPGFEHIAEAAYHTRMNMARAAEQRVKIKGYLERLHAEREATLERRRNIRRNQPDYARPYIQLLQALSGAGAIACLILSTDSAERPTASFYAGDTEAMIDLAFPTETVCRVRVCTGENGEVMELAVSEDESLMERNFSDIAAFIGRTQGRFEEIE